MKKFLSLLSLSFTMFFHAQQNVVITNIQHPNEPSIIINPNNTQNIVVGENSRRYFVSNDGGLTWTQKMITSNFGYCCDPCLDADMNGNLYFFHLSNPNNGSWIDRIVCQKSTNNGNSFDAVDSYTGLNSTEKQDKQWSVIDNQNNIVYVTWTQFDQYGTPNPTKFSNILFSKSTDGGNTWSNPVQINETSGNCVDDDDTVEGAVPAVGPNGEVYVAWVGPAGLVFDKSTDHGQTWLQHDIVIDNMQGSGGWAYTIPGINRCDGLPITKCDLSNGPHRGNIYVNWSDQRNGTDNTDIWLAKSADGGNTWSAPIKVNNDNSNKHQFLTWMDIDQTTGYLYFVFYDRRNYNDNNTDVYMAVSTDGGQTFINRKISESPFIPNSGTFFGDYNNLSVHNGIVRPVWGRLHNGNQSLMTAILSQNDLLSVPEEKIKITDAKIYPVPSFNDVFVKYKLLKTESISINIYDESGRLVKTPIKYQKRNQGKNVEKLNLKELNLSKGIYFIELSTSQYKKALRMLKI